ncbi:Nucleotidyltransferase [Trichoderma longibrachiatum ATCC 18648]|uniref:DNA polymerase n=1 Tax=Trichoderma longibrachiatum ATCC 18648 TaxID=983965 RepID=A0A2T4BTB5_TRILO|nr:Nucleotidyltransferase [Trichoderma longibrachiatum ATCC 18648]
MAPDLPPIFLLPTHLQADEARELEAKVPSLTQDAREARVIVGKISRPERALFELRRLKLVTEPVAAEDVEGEGGDKGIKGEGEASKRARGSDAAVVDVPSKRQRLMMTGGGSRDGEGYDGTLDLLGGPEDVVLVVKLAWLLDSLERDVAQPVRDYLLYRGRKLPSQLSSKSQKDDEEASRQSHATRSSPSAVLARARQDQKNAPNSSPYSKRTSRPGTSSSTASDGARGRTEPPTLYHETTSEHDVPLPPIPEYLHTTYSCERPSPVNPPNAAFIAELKAIRTLRLLRGDAIGVRAYSTSIASLAAYPYAIQRPQEIERLPGCGVKIARLYQQWAITGSTEDTRGAETDTELAVLKMFYEIWGVGDVTARQFYNKGWRDLDDIVEYGWNSLSRVQQIGVKFYDEFQLRIPRQETEAISSVILAHARRVDPGFQMVVVGSYRRGKPTSGDVDVIVSHPDEAQTLGIIEKLVSSLEKSGFITHILSIWTRNSERGQAPLAWKGDDRPSGSGFDTLDKALVVWQDPGTKGEGGPHRRVDIIISPWKTAGCAILGWSGETTFQRDLRRYCKARLGLKFDSSGVRSRADGAWVDLEGAEGRPAPDMETAERRVFEGLDLEWRPPEERCTG